MTPAFIEAHQFSNSELTQLWKTYWYIPKGFSQNVITVSPFSIFFRFSQLVSVSESAAVSSARKWLFCDNMSTCDHSDAHREYVTKIRIT